DLIAVIDGLFQDFTDLGILRKTANAAPKFRGNRAPCRPTFLREIGEHAGEIEIRPAIDVLNWEERDADEYRFQDHLVPRRFVQMIRWIRIPVGDGFDDGLDVAADSFSRTANMAFRIRKNG